MCHCHKVPVLYFSMIWSAHQLRYVRKSAGVPTANARIRTCNLPIVSINQRKQWAAIQSADWWWKADWFIVLCHTVDKTAGSIWQSGINWGTYDNSSDMLHIFRSSKTDHSSNVLWNYLNVIPMPISMHDVSPSILGVVLISFLNLWVIPRLAALGRLFPAFRRLLLLVFDHHLLEILCILSMHA